MGFQLPILRAGMECYSSREASAVSRDADKKQGG
jgi:hypothetical protein